MEIPHFIQSQIPYLWVSYVGKNSSISRCGRKWGNNAGNNFDTNSAHTK